MKLDYDETESKKKHFWLYVIKLNEGKYYIGTTKMSNPQDRIGQHKHGFYSAQWVKKYKYLKTLEVINISELTEAEADKQELKRTLQYMKKYGYNNVRGSLLNYSGKYFKIGDRYVRDDQTRIIAVVLFFMIIFAAQIILR